MREIKINKSMGCNYYPPTPNWRKDGTAWEKIEFIVYTIGFVLILPLWLPFIILDLIFNWSGKWRK